MVKINRNKVQQVINWCELKFGINNSKGRVKFRLYNSCGFSLSKNGLCGECNYETNTLSIYKGSHKTMQELCCTILHEYIHYLIDKPTNDYNEIFELMQHRNFDDEYIYSNHPHEKICITTEEKYGSLCYHKLKHKLYKRDNNKARLECVSN